MSGEIFDFAIVGAGMAGASLAAELAPDASVLVLEAEDHPGYHATGRSAAFWEECYGGPDIVPLTLASGEFLDRLGLLNRRGALYIGRGEDRPKLDAFMDRFAGTGTGIEIIGRGQLALRFPGLHADWCEAIWEPACADIDVAALHAHYLSLSNSAGVELAVNARLISALWKGGQWLLQTADNREFHARVLINAAGAWADEIAAMAGCKPLGITPYRRTVVQLQTDPAPAPDLPLVLDISGEFYFKPENGKLWLSPHDEEPSVPCDAAPEELAVAQAIDRFEKVANLSVKRVETKWAGLRSFAPDRLPIYGSDPLQQDFFWFAGQGGFGIQTAPAAALLAATQLLGKAPPASVAHIDAEKYSPDRFG